MKKIIAAVFLAATCVLAHAETTPISNKLDSRVREAVYVDGQVYKLYTTLLRATTIEFPPGEVLNNIVAGDSDSLQFQSVPGGRLIAIKPVIKNLNTNITLYTNRRAYYFNVIESPKATYFAVRFNGGYTVKENTLTDTTPHLDTTAPYVNYGANKQAAITPTKIWDDGVFTYFQFYPTAPIPAIFKTDNGRESSVNSTVQLNHVMRVSGLSNYWSLRSDQTNVVVKRMQPGTTSLSRTETNHVR